MSLHSVFSDNGLLSAADGWADHHSDGPSVRLPVLCILGASVSMTASVVGPAPPPEDSSAAQGTAGAAATGAGVGVPLAAGLAGIAFAMEVEPLSRAGEAAGQTPREIVRRPSAPMSGGPPAAHTAAAGAAGGGGLTVQSLDVAVAVDSVSVWVSQRRLRLLKSVGARKDGAGDTEGNQADSSRESSQRAANEVPLSVRIDAAAAAAAQSAGAGGAASSRVRSIAVPAIAASASLHVGCIAALLMDDEGVTSPVLEAALLDLQINGSSNAPAAGNGGAPEPPGGAPVGATSVTAAAAASIWERLGIPTWAEDSLEEARSDAVRVRVSAVLQADYHNDEKVRHPAHRVP